MLINERSGMTIDTIILKKSEFLMMNKDHANRIHITVINKSMILHIMQSVAASLYVKFR